MTSVTSSWELPLCLAEPMPAGSKTDELQVKAEPISNGENIFKKV